MHIHDVCLCPLGMAISFVKGNFELNLNIEMSLFVLCKDKLKQKDKRGTYGCTRLASLSVFLVLQLLNANVSLAKAEEL